MFFHGGLQEGISVAIQQAKQVVCFVTGKLSWSFQKDLEQNPLITFIAQSADHILS
jgi:hypothetical protein